MYLTQHGENQPKFGIIKENIKYKIICQQMPESDEINHVYELQNAKNNNPVHAVRND